MKKVLIAVSAVLSLVMLTPLAAFAAKNGGDGFSDVDSAKWYYDDVSKVCSSNLMKGVSATKFDPEGTLTRGMCATILYRAAKEPAVKAKATFTDVEAGAYYADAVAWAQSEGVVNGKTATEFDPDGDITREEFATMLYRYTDAEDLTLPETRDGEPVDADEVSDYAADAVDNMYKGEVVNGRENGEFDPDDDITRAETAAMMNRFLERVTVRWTTFYRTLNETWDYDAWVTFDQDAEGGFYKDVGLFDLNIGYVPEGFVSHEFTESYEEFPGHRYIILYDHETNPEAPYRVGPSSISVYIREGDKEVEYSDESFALTEETTINGMAAMIFDFVHEVDDGSNLDGQMIEVGDLAFGDKNFTVRLHWLGLCDDGSIKNEAIKVAESIKAILID